MVAPFGRISFALPTRIFPGFAQSLNKWSLPKPDIVVIGIIGAVVLYVIYQMVRSTLGASKKITTVYFPPDQLKALGFITIFQDCIGNSRDIVEVKAMIEDAQGRRIATRYMPGIDGHADIFAYLPRDQEVFLRLKVTRKGYPVEILAPIRFKIDQEVGLYEQSERKFSSLPLAKHPYNPAGWNRHYYDTKTFKSMGVTCSKVNRMIGITHIFQDSRAKTDTITVESRNDLHNLIQVSLIPSFTINQQNTPILFYYVGNSRRKEFHLNQLIKDWKAAYKQETGKQFVYRLGDHNNASNFYLEAMSYSSYGTESLS